MKLPKEYIIGILVGIALSPLFAAISRLDDSLNILISLGISRFIDMLPEN